MIMCYRLLFPLPANDVQRLRTKPRTPEHPMAAGAMAGVPEGRTVHQQRGLLEEKPKLNGKELEFHS